LHTPGDRSFVSEIWRNNTMKNITQTQQLLLERLRASAQTIEVRWHEERGVAAVLQGGILPDARAGDGPAGEPAAILERFLEEYGALIGPEKTAAACRFVESRRSPAGQVRIRAMQTAGDIPIHGATLLLFADSERGVYRVQSGLYREAQAPPLIYRGKPVDLGQRAAALRARLDGTLRKSAEGKRFVDRKLDGGFGDDKVAQENFPLAAPPEHWLYPVPGGLVHAWRLSAYQPAQWLGVDGNTYTAIDLVDLVVDLITGRTISQGSRLGAWVDVAADGLSTLQQSGAYITRALQAVREDGADRLLANRTATPQIITHDAGGTETGLETKLKNNTDISRDADGHWNATTTSITANNRRDSQQPETDGHFHALEAVQYVSQFGWTGFDNGEWGSAPCIVRVGAHIGMGANAYFWRYIDNGRHYGYIAFFDGLSDGTNLTYDFMAGDPVIFAHEFQHGVTYFGSVDSTGNPGYLETSGWHRALHEGLSDSVAGLRTGTWVTPGFWPNGACRNNLPFRRVEYPRSNNTKDGDSYCDHYDDRVAASSPYTNSTILSHAFYLAGAGGIHERTSRAAQLIPVSSAGALKIGEILHHAVTQLFDSIPANSQGGKTMIEAANLILDAAEAVTGTKRSPAYVMLRRAFYAVGLFPYNESYTKTNYGGEACMLPWTIDWQHSQPYLGLPALWYKSPDLFINNGAGQEYDAEVGVENNLFARVRNIGDQALTNVVVRFYFRAHGTGLPPSSTQWKPCKDSGGNDCVLTIAALAAGSMNFTDENNPPASQGVKWFLDSSEVVSGLDHFCVRAEIACTAPNHDNDASYAVQSNVSYSTPTGLHLKLAFLAANFTPEPAPLDLEVDARALPTGVRVKFDGPGSLREIRLKPKEEKLLNWSLELTPGTQLWGAPPYDGAVTGTARVKAVEGSLAGILSGVKAERTLPARGSDKVAIQGLLAGTIQPKGGRRVVRAVGRFKGTLDRKLGRLTGVWETIPGKGSRELFCRATIQVKGILQPTRAVHFTQRVHGRVVGGVTFTLRPPKRP
jgi:Zn-dependent metalloprotease